jgi:ATP-dependent Lhr-like helicase
MAQACIYLRPDDAANVQVIEAAGERLSFVCNCEDTWRAELIKASRRQQNSLRSIFSITCVAPITWSLQVHANRLKSTLIVCGLCARTPASRRNFILTTPASRDHRDLVERRLKDGKLPTTAICTSTLELGIDIGDVSCVAQIGALSALPLSGSASEIWAPRWQAGDPAPICC